MSEENKALYSKFIDEVIGNKNLAAIDDLIAPDFIDHSPVPGTLGGKEDMKQAMGMFLGAFSDFKSTVNFMVAEGDCCQSAKVGQIGTREDYCYEELRVSSLRVLL